MAMTKKELAALEAALTAAALRSTQPWAPDVVPSDEWGVITTGWTYNEHVPEVRQVWVKNGIAFVENPARGREYLSGSRAIPHMYSTRLLAMRAMRYAVECKCARQLREIDRAIERAQEAGE